MAPTQKTRAARKSVKRRKALPAGSTIPVREQESAKGKRVWSLDEFTRELARAKRIGPRKMSNNQLLNFCEGAHGVYKRCFVNIPDFFIEAWRRIEDYDMPEVGNSKRQFCDRIGCTQRWAQMIVAGTAGDSNKSKKTKKEARGEVTSPDLELPTGTGEDIAIKQLDRLFRELQPLRELHDPRYQESLGIMWPHIKEASEMKYPNSKTARSAAAD